MFPDIKRIYTELNTELRLERAVPILRANRELVQCVYIKTTAQGVRTAYLAAEGHDPARIRLVEVDTLVDGSTHTKTTAVTDAHFADRIQDVLATRWDSVERKTEKRAERRERDGFVDRLDAAENTAKAENRHLERVVSNSERRGKAR